MDQTKSSAPLLQLQGLSKFYTGSSVVMGLNHVNLSFEAGEFVAITGESGSGKSTLAHILSGILPYENGEMLLRGQPTSHFDGADWERYRRENISFISQSYGILTGASVLSNVVSALRLTGMDEADAKRRAQELLELVELWDLRQRRAGKLSSGQKQRLSIARALAKPAPILIADEPTGNLDPENSMKVIGLLAQAARERLVILITHDFQEAQDCATRRIQLQDGRVVLDTPLRDFVPAVPEQKQRTGKTRPLSYYIAALQLKARPVWSILVLLFFALSAFAVFAFLGTFLVNLDDTSTRIYDNSAFYNGDKTRIVVQRQDLEQLTQEDMQAIVNVPYAKSLERSGYVTDISYAYQPDVDYKMHYTISRVSSEVIEETFSVELLSSMNFMRTVPMLPEDETFLTAGRLPERADEVVLAGSADRIGEVIHVYIQDVKNWASNQYYDLDVEVVGVTDWGSGLYFSDDMGRIFTSYMMSGGKFGESRFVIPDYGTERLLLARGVEANEDTGEIYAYRSLTDDECLLSPTYYNMYAYTTVFDQNKQPIKPVYVRDYNRCLRDADVTDDTDYIQLDAVGAHEYPFRDLLIVSEARFKELTWAGTSNQVTLYIEDYAYTQQVIETLQAMGYSALSPFQQCSTQKDPTLAAERMQTLLVCLGALIAVAVLQILVLRELFGIQKESYKLLADQGLGRVTAKRSLTWQILLFAVLGQLLGFGAIFAGGALNIQRIVGMLRYLRGAQWGILSGAHLLITLLGLATVMRTVGKAVYPATGSDADLKLEEVAL